MGTINTLFNGASAAANRRTARGVGQLLEADRLRDLQARGLITPRSTLVEISAVEQRLAAQDRARMALQGYPQRRYPYKLALMIGGFVTVASMAHAGSSNATGLAALLFFVVPVVVVAAVAIPLVRRSERRRVDLVATADWGADGTCRWCGSTDEHIVDGEPEHPRIAHAVEVEHAIGG